MKNNEQINKPFFILVGAPKSGTTALATYLSEHQDIGFSYFKEPNYFNTDFSESQRYFTNQCSPLEKKGNFKIRC